MKEGASVKIQRKIHKKRYLQGKGTYKYERLYLPIPKRSNELFKPCLNQKLNMEVENEGDRLATKYTNVNRCMYACQVEESLIHQLSIALNQQLLKEARENANEK